MKKIANKLVTVALLLAVTPIVAAAPINLSSWSALTLDYLGGQGAGSWVLESGNTAVKQVINADPSFYLNNLNQTSYSITGSWEVTETGGDDDYMGFVFGYQNSSNFYLFDWKQSAQGYVGRTAAEGMAVKKFTGGTGNGLTDLSLEEFWENQVDFGDMDVLATNQSATNGWVDNTLYNFSLDFNNNPNEIKIVVKQGVTTLWETLIYDSTFSSGQFGFYNNSQQNVRYAGFEQEGGVIVDPNDPPTDVPEPGTLALLALGLLGMGFARRRTAG